MWYWDMFMRRKERYQPPLKDKKNMREDFTSKTGASCTAGKHVLR